MVIVSYDMATYLAYEKGQQERPSPVRIERDHGRHFSEPFDRNSRATIAFVVNEKEAAELVDASVQPS